MKFFSATRLSFCPLIIFSLCYLELTQGLQCYKCSNIEGDPALIPEEFRGHNEASCKKYTKPDSKLLQQCDFPEQEGKETTCLTIHAKGNDSAGIKEAFIRDCANLDTFVPVGCTPLTTGFVLGIPSIPDSIKKLAVPGISITGCGCRTNGCSAEGIEEVTTTPSNKPPPPNSAGKHIQTKLPVAFVSVCVILTFSILSV